MMTPLFPRLFITRQSSVMCSSCPSINQNDLPSSAENGGLNKGITEASFDSRKEKQTSDTIMLDGAALMHSATWGGQTLHQHANDMNLAHLTSPH